MGAIRYVGKNDTDLQRKQQLLDLQKALARRAAREANEEAKKGNDRNEDYCEKDGEENDGAHDISEQSVEDIPRESISAHWSAACVLLGSGPNVWMLSQRGG